MTAFGESSGATGPTENRLAVLYAANVPLPTGAADTYQTHEALTNIAGYDLGDYRGRGAGSYGIQTLLEAQRVFHQRVSGRSLQAIQEASDQEVARIQELAAAPLRNVMGIPGQGYPSDMEIGEDPEGRWLERWPAFLEAVHTDEHIPVRDRLVVAHDMLAFLAGNWFDSLPSTIDQRRYAAESILPRVGRLSLSILERHFRAPIGDVDHLRITEGGLRRAIAFLTQATSGQ